MWIAIQNAVGARQGVGGGPGPTPPPYTPPMDAYPADIAYSVRKLSSSYSGPCMEVQRVVDAATLDIGFDSNGLLDTQAIIDFATAGGGFGEIRIRTWYDQTGNSRHAQTSVAADMSYIYSGSAIYQANGKPVVDPRGTNDGLYPILGTYSTAANNTIFTVISPGLTGGSYVMTRPIGSGGSGILGAGIEEPIAGWNSGIDYGFGTTQYYRDGAFYGNSTLQRNDIMQSVLASRRIMGIGFTQSGLNSLNFGRNTSSSIYATQEYIVYFSDQLGTVPRTALEGNINSYYQVANLPDYTSGFLADYSGAAAAYSVRKLSNTAIKALRVRRTVPPFDEQDIGFTPAGDLDEAAISTFGGADTLVVSRWYDQSGFSRHAVQISPGFQPQIYNGTSVVTKNGNPALAFGGTHFVAQIDVINQPSTYVSVHDIVTNSGYTYPWSAGNTLQEFTSFGLTQSIAIAGSYLNGPNIDDYMVSSVVFNGTSSIVRTNGTVGITGNTGTSSTGTSLGIGARFTGSNQLVSGSIMQELIVWPTNQTSPTNNLPAIETNINDYYYAYNTSGFVVDYPGAAAAFSVRQLGNRQRYAMQVKRLAGSNDTLDIGFDSNGDLDTQAIIDFGGSDRLGVSFWYDQSGNGKNASQTSLINMPIIYDGSSVITDTNGIPALGRNITGSTFSLGDVLAASAPANATFISVVKGDSNSNIIYNGGGGRSIHSLTTNNNISVFNAGATGIAGSLPATTDTLLAVQVTGTSTTDQGWRNGVFSYSGNSGTLAPKTANLGQATLTGSPVLMQELIVYPSDIDAGGTRTNIETNIMTYYGIP